MKFIGFYELRSFSNINKSIKSELRKSFPEYQVIEIDIFDIVNRSKLTLLLNILYAFFEYLPDLLSGKKRIKECFVRNSFMFWKIKRIALHQSRVHKFDFTFQTQSVFDTSTPGIPHFVFTDNTILANLENPYYNRFALPSRRWLNLEKSIYKNASIIFTMSTNVSRSLERDYGIPSIKIKCVYAGSNVQLNGAISRQRDYSKRHILFVGGNWYRKGGPILIEAFKKVLEIYPDTRLTIISGRAPQIDFPNCRVYGRLSLKEVSRFFEEASVFCLPTSIEPFGIVFLEAMMYSLPVVTTNISAIPDFIIDGENGYLVEPKNVDQLTVALLKILENPDRRKSFGERGYSIYKEKYKWEIVLSKIREHIIYHLTKQSGNKEFAGFMVSKDGILINLQTGSEESI